MSMFSFSVASGWQGIQDFLETPETSDRAEERRLAGFSSYPALSVGETDAGTFSVEVYNREFDAITPKGPQFQFLVSIDVGGIGHYVAVSALPDLLELLRQTVPLSVTIDEWLIKKEKYDEELNEKARSGKL